MVGGRSDFKTLTDKHTEKKRNPEEGLGLPKGLFPVGITVKI